MKTINQHISPVDTLEITKKHAEDLEFLQQVAGLRCQDCEQIKDDVKNTTCPFASEIHNETLHITVCEDCEYERAMNI